MAKNKLRRFAEMKDMPNVFEPSMKEVKSGGIGFKGEWRERVFKNDHPIVLELGCGKGEYSVGLARKFPTINFIGIDIKGARMWVGAGEALEEGLTNVAFLRTKVDFVDQLFSENEVDEIWLTFSDPQPKKPNKRLTSRGFVQRYKNILKPGGLVHLKTDSDLLFEFTEEEIKKYNYNTHYLTWDVYADLKQFPQNLQEILSIKTHYEALFSAKGSIIKYARFELDENQ